MANDTSNHELRRLMNRRLEAQFLRVSETLGEEEFKFVHLELKHANKRMEYHQVVGRAEYEMLEAKYRLESCRRMLEYKRTFPDMCFQELEAMDAKARKEEEEELRLKKSEIVEAEIYEASQGMGFSPIENPSQYDKEIKTLYRRIFRLTHPEGRVGTNFTDTQVNRLDEIWQESCCRSANHRRWSPDPHEMQCGEGVSEKKSYSGGRRRYWHLEPR